MPFTPGSIASKYTGGGTTTGNGFVPGSIADKATSSLSKSSGGFVAGSISGKYGQKKPDLNTVEGLSTYAHSVGLGSEADKITNTDKRLSFLQRLGAGLGAFNTANAVIKGADEGVVSGAFQYGKDIVAGLGSAFTGHNYQGDRKTYSDVVEKLGITNGIAKFGLGVAGDILLDPTTYFGGAIAEGIGKGLGIGSEVALKTVGRLAPETETGLRLAGTGLKDAFGKAFVSGYKSSEGAQADVLSFLNKSDKAKFGLAASNLNRLGTGVLTKEQSEELALKLVAGKRAEFLAREAGKTPEEIAAISRTTAQSTDPAIQAAIEAQRARSAKFAGQLGVDNPYETYFPFIKKQGIDNFTKEIAAKNIKVGSEGYLKEFKNLLTNGEIELDPAKAFFNSEAQQVTNRMTGDFLEGFAKKYGKSLDSFNSAEEAAQAGFKVLREKGVFGKEIGYISKYDSNLLGNLVSPEFQTVNMLGKATGFDAITNLFKRSVTGLFLPFHVRNYASGIMQNFEVLGVDSLNPKNIAAGQKLAYHVAAGTEPVEGLLKVAGKDIKMSQVFKSFTDRFGSDTFYTNDFLGALQNGGTELKSAEGILSKSALRSTLGFEKGNILPIVGTDGVPFRAARTIGQFIEHQQKATAYITALGQGKGISEALNLAERAGFDYRNLTAFESQIMKRIVPFYSFTRKNVELQLRTLGENPQRVNQILSFFSNIGDKPTEEEKKNLPDYINQSIGIKLADLPNGIKQYISSFGTPVESFAGLINGNPILQQISTFNPLFKVPIEIGIGKDSFRQKDLKDVYDASEYKGMPQVVKDLLDIKEVQKDVLVKGGNGKLKKTGERTQYIADPVKLLIARSLFTSRGITYLDQVFGNDIQGFTKVLKTTTGIKPQRVDLGQQQSIKETEQKRALEDLLKKQGDLASFTRSFIPKN